MENCSRCIDHASGIDCSCEQNWSGEICEIYSGDCDHRCDKELGCSGPTNKDCLQCNSFAYLYEEACLCIEGYAGLGCETYEGPCHPDCIHANGCTGPSETDCEVCKPNAHANSHGDCVCDEGYEGDDC